MEWAAKQVLILKAERHSPCMGLCKLDDETGYCIGCFRTIDEIARWSSLDPSARFEIWEQLPERRPHEAKTARLLPLTPEEILKWAALVIENRLGVWITGTPGASAEFIASPHQKPCIILEGHQLVARTDDASFRLIGYERMRAFAFQEGVPIMLGAPKARIDWRPNSVLTNLGGDAAALIPDCRDHLLFDLGLGSEFNRVCIRTSNRALISVLEKFEGKSWRALIAAAEGPHIAAASPHRVVELPLARIELYAPIPLFDKSSPKEAHTRFLPSFLAHKAEIDPSLALPDYVAPIAILLPT